MVRLRNWWQNFLQFYCKLWNFWFVWWSVNTNNNYATIVWKRNPYHTKLIICMTHWKIWPHVSMCNNLSQTLRRRLLICQIEWYVWKPEYPRTSRQVLAENHISDTIMSAAQLNSDSSKFLPNERMFSCNIKKYNLGSYNIVLCWNGEVATDATACEPLQCVNCVGMHGEVATDALLVSLISEIIVLGWGGGNWCHCL